MVAVCVYRPPFIMTCARCSLRLISKPGILKQVAHSCTCAVAMVYRTHATPTTSTHLLLPTRGSDISLDCGGENPLPQSGTERRAASISVLVGTADAFRLCACGYLSPSFRAFTGAAHTWVLFPRRWAAYATAVSLVTRARAHFSRLHLLPSFLASWPPHQCATRSSLGCPHVAALPPAAPYALSSPALFWTRKGHTRRNNSSASSPLHISGTHTRLDHHTGATWLRLSA